MTPKEQQDLQQLAPGLVHFLPKRMYENYLLDPEAVAEVMNAIDGSRPGRPVSASEVMASFTNRRDQRDPHDRPVDNLSTFCKGTVDVPDNWESKIEAANLLKDVFTELSETRVEYEKTTHSVAITELLPVGNRGH